MPSFHSAALDYCRWLTRSSGSNFVPALRLLPRPRREGMEVVYAFCRAVDDLVDRNGGGEKGAGERAAKELTLWRRELRACAEGFPSHPIAVALAPVVRDYRIPIELFEAILSGVEMDLIPRRYAAFEELRIYCERVASAVGQVSIRIFGCRHPASGRYATALGIALQLTNILRDLKPDAAQGRVYLPLEDLSRFGYSEEELLENRTNDSFKRLMAFEAQRARSFFQEAEKALAESGEGRLLLPARLMGAVYFRILNRIERRDGDVFSRRVTVPGG